LRFLSFSIDKQQCFGAVVENRIVDLGKRMSDYTSLKEVIAARALVRARDIASESSADYEMKEIRFEPPIVNPDRIISIGGNYPGRKQARGADSPPSQPGIYLRTRESIVGHLQPLVRPLESQRLDYEGEIALIIGNGGRRIQAKDAIGHIAGLTLANDGFVGDWVQPGSHSVTVGKNFQHTGALGPWLVTTDQFPDLADVSFTTRVNGDLRQQDSTASMNFSFEYLISYLSTFMPLNPGDVILTGSPAGIGAEMDPPHYLEADDAVEIESELIGKLTNAVTLETTED
jgi:2-keto-4-pentenoate hydratase/2-oxohepta-3-ene-1,7-dioic acid hydratase in catechol pathway